ncbi:MAG: putative metal-binding motif-containing protein [Candidatus Uhrbacteria bacterium]
MNKGFGFCLVVASSLLLSSGCAFFWEKPDQLEKNDTGTVTDTAEIVDTADVYPDDDGDGFTADEDCDDASAAIHPGADEICDSLDNDCNGIVDDGEGCE